MEFRRLDDGVSSASECWEVTRSMKGAVKLLMKLGVVKVVVVVVDMMRFDF